MGGHGELGVKSGRTWGVGSKVWEDMGSGEYFLGEHMECCFIVFNCVKGVMPRI